MFTKHPMFVHKICDFPEETAAGRGEGALCTISRRFFSGKYGGERGCFRQNTVIYCPNAYEIFARGGRGYGTGKARH